nr:unnamed protein product [Digitaria exilis]
MRSSHRPPPIRGPAAGDAAAAVGDGCRPSRLCSTSASASSPPRGSVLGGGAAAAVGRRPLIAALLCLVSVCRSRPPSALLVLDLPTADPAAASLIRQWGFMSVSSAVRCCSSLLGESFISPPTTNHSHNGQHASSIAIPKGLSSLATEYRRLAIDCVRVLRLEMQLEAIYHMQEMTKREYIEDQDAEDPDDFIISLTTQIARRDEEMAPYITESKRNYVFGGISSVAASASIKALAQMKSINLLGVQQICRNSIALEQVLERSKGQCAR